MFEEVSSRKGKAIPHIEGRSPANRYNLIGKS